MKKLIALVAAIPIAAFAQGAPPKGGAQAPGAGPGRANPEMVQKRARLALTLGLAVALDLDEPQALKLGEVVARSAERRRAIHDQVRDAHQVLRRAAGGEKVAASEVDQAIARIQDGRAQLQALDRELVASVTKDLSPEKKARAVLFLEKFHRRFGAVGPGPGPGMRPGMQHGPGMMRGGPGRGPPGQGMRGGPPMGMDPEDGPGSMAGLCPGPDCDFELEPD